MFPCGLQHAECAVVWSGIGFVEGNLPGTVWPFPELGAHQAPLGIRNAQLLTQTSTHYGAHAASRTAHSVSKYGTYLIAVNWLLWYSSLTLACIA